MLKNTVFSNSVDTKEWLRAAFIRAIKTMAQVMMASITVGSALADIDWVYILSTAAVAGIASILTSIIGIPEVTEKEVE